jgi:hypothetical protein
MREPPIPFMSYVFVGVTSVVLALVTVLDKGGAIEDNKSPESSTSMLPNIFSSSPSSSIDTSPSIFSSLKVENGSQSKTDQIKTGGKKRKTRSKRSKKTVHKNDV